MEKERQAKHGSYGSERHYVSGKFLKGPRCDACNKPTGRDYCTDDEVCGGDDGPGFYVCERKRCVAKREHLSVVERFELYCKAERFEGKQVPGETAAERFAAVSERRFRF